MAWRPYQPPEASSSQAVANEIPTVVLLFGGNPELSRGRGDAAGHCRETLVGCGDAVAGTAEASTNCGTDKKPNAATAIEADVRCWAHCRLDRILNFLPGQ